MPNPLDVLRDGDAPVAPDAAFAQELRARVVSALLAHHDPSGGVAMTAPDTTTHVSDRNGRREGDLSYVSLAAPDPARAEAFYGRLFGWNFAPGRYGREQGLEVIPQVGIYDGRQPAGNVVRGAVLSYRVDDITLALERVRAAGGRATDAEQRAYGLESLVTDDQGIEFYLHQLADASGSDGPDLSNGRQHGDVAYVTIGVRDLPRAERFYGSVLGWTFRPGSHPNGRQIDGVTPMSGMSQGDRIGAQLSYRVDDIAAAVRLIQELGGTADRVDERPYGLAVDNCTDDQGVEFGLLQLG